MGTRRVSQLQNRLLGWRAAEERRTGGGLSSRPQELGSARQGDKGNSSQSLRTLEARGLVVIGRAHGGQAASVSLTSEGQKWARHFAGSCDES
jgi:hypothetical protein